MFKNSMAQFKEYPGSVKSGIIFLIAGWIWLFITLHYVKFFQDQSPFKFYIAGALICYYVVKIKNWARALCMFGNVLIITQLLPTSVEFFSRGNMQLGVIVGANAVFASLSIYYLIIKESSAFFKEYNKKDEDSAETIEPEKQNNS